jgi:uncharacterized protein YgiM (DUF1202 family)
MLNPAYSMEASMEEKKNVAVGCATCKTVAEIVNDIELKRNAKIKTKYEKDKNIVKLATQC